MTSPSSEDLISLFKSAGLPQSKAAEATKNAKGAAILRDLVLSYNLVSAGLSEKQAVLVSALSLQLGKAQNIGGEERAYIVNAILEEKLKSVDQVNGFAVTAAQLEEHVKQYMDANNTSTWSHLGVVIGGVKNIPALRWANPLDIKNAVERVFTEKFGPREGEKLEAEKTASRADASDTLKPPVAEYDLAQSAKARRIVFEEGFLDNPQIHSHLREQHLAATGGRVYTRFPPEPNGYLHIGHCKAIFAHHSGNCYLRFDDTNPEKEEAQYFDSIIEVIHWLGFEPLKITYSSDYFDQLYTLAEDLIKRDKAYVCHCSQEQIRADRGEKVSSPKACLHRSRPVEESLTEFRRMRDGHYRPKEAFLRMKQDLSDGNPQMWDLPAYRVLDAPHHRTWIQAFTVYREFIASRQSYEWLCDALEVYKPRQSEYGRLNIQGTINSKRKLLQLVEEKYVSGWDDPRLYTVIALRRRGVPPEAILNFVSSLGVSVAASNIQIVRFEQSVRQYLEGSVPRLLMVLRPLKVTIENLPEDYVLMIEKLLHPKVPELGTSVVPFTRTIYIDADDFRLEDSKDYFRLAPGKTVGLFQAPHPITCTSYVKDASTGQVTEVICRLEERDARKPKAFIQWVAEHAPSGSPVRVDETRLFYPLFKSDNPLAAVPDFRADINSNSMEVIRGAMVEIGFWPLARESMRKALEESRSRIEKMRTPAVTSERLVGKECIRFQGLRVAYFALDKAARIGMLDQPGTSAGVTQGDYLVLNRIVSLKEDAGKGAS
ncbi:glutaminyl-tRNA synthetase [Pisolithus albus]|nr:glutaminyl-tRNA synthetase [Pisolithus albus]